MQREELEEKDNSIKHRVTIDDAYGSIKEYLGKYADIIKSISVKERETFVKVLPNVQKTFYFVKGREALLKKFKAYFIAKCALERYEYSSMMMKDYIEGIVNKNDNELFIAGINKSLLFLYLHGSSAGIGNSDNWLASVLLDKAVNRKREGLITVILSEKDFPQIEGSKEVKIINLGGAEISATLQDLKEQKSEGTSIKNSTPSIYD